MAVNLTNADSALKTYYLDAVAEQLNFNVNPFLAAVKQTSEDVWGKEVRKLAIHGINGGIGAGTEDGSLPTASGNDYAQFVTTLKNLYGTIEISDKAVRASENNTGAFVNLLNAEMEGLIKSSSYNMGRMLFGDGSGVLATVMMCGTNNVAVDNTRNLIEGMIIDFRDENGNLIEGATGRKILKVNRVDHDFTFSGAAVSRELIPECSLITIQGSYENEITGLGAIFSSNRSTLYGLNKSECSWLTPYVKTDVGEINELELQKAIDMIEKNGGGSVNFIMCSWGVRRALQKVLSVNKCVDVTELAGGYKAMTYNGIPIVVDRFCPEGTMYLLNTDDFALHQLCDWQWLEGDDGKVLKQIPGKPVYSATLVKYADLICSRPCGQGMLTGITEK